jgi:hypothetical protein
MVDRLVVPRAVPIADPKAGSRVDQRAEHLVDSMAVQRDVRKAESWDDQRAAH